MSLKNTGSLTHLIEAMHIRHTELDARIVDEGKRPLPDADRLRRLKVKRLAAKDQLARLSAR